MNQCFHKNKYKDRNKNKKKFKIKTTGSNRKSNKIILMILGISTHKS